MKTEKSIIQKIRLMLMSIIMILVFPLFAQKPSMELLFSGDNNGDNVSLDSIYIKNMTQRAEVMLYAPDTLLYLLLVGLDELPANPNITLSLTRNFPNPFKDKTELDPSMEKSGVLKIDVFNQLGKRVAQFKRSMMKGTHHFSFLSGGEKVYLLSATAFGIAKSIKMFCLSDSKADCGIKYIGNETTKGYFKSEECDKDFPFELGDELLFVGYSALGESGRVESPEESTTYTFQFATNIPCIGVPTVDYEGQTYNTIQIFSQCWFKENLNVGEMIPTSQSQTNNNTIEKYCPLDDEYNCNTFAGALYQWSEMMNYANEPVVQGICPEGWHIPTDFDWQVLEGAVDSVFDVFLLPASKYRVFLDALCTVLL